MRITCRLVNILIKKKTNCSKIKIYPGKENTVLRARVPKEKVSVIPNAVDTAFFIPDPSQRPNDGLS